MRAATRVRVTRDRAWLETEQFDDEPLYCDARTSGRPGADDILLSGSDDEHYESPAERRLRIEEQAHRYIEGKSLTIISASLHGPFDKEYGWKNPWRSRSAPARNDDKKRKATTVQESPRPFKRTRPEAPKPRVATNRGRNGTTAGRNIIPRNPASSAVVPCSSFRYMDDDAATRVIDWAQSVVIETQDEAAISGDRLGIETAASRSCGPPSSAAANLGDDTTAPFSSQSATNSASVSSTLKPGNASKGLPMLRMPDARSQQSPKPRQAESLAESVSDHDDELPEPEEWYNMEEAEPHETPKASANIGIIPPDITHVSPLVESASDDDELKELEEPYDLQEAEPHETPKASANTGFIPSDITDLSPLAVKVYQEQIRYADKSPPPETPTPTQTTVIAAVAASLERVQKVPDISYLSFSDRSFRFKSKKKLKKKPFRKSRLSFASAELPNAGDGAREAFAAIANSNPSASGEPVRDEHVVAHVAEHVPEHIAKPAAKLVTEHITSHIAKPVTEHAAEHVAETVLSSRAHEATETQEVPLPQRAVVADQDFESVDKSPIQNKLPREIPALQSPRTDSAKQSTVSAAPSVHSLKLTAVKSPLFKSAAPNLMSLGTFSWEKEQSQSSFLAELPEMPRKLLWPRSQQQASQQQAGAQTPSDPIALPLFDWIDPNSSFSDIPTPRVPAQSQSKEPEGTPGEDGPAESLLPCADDHSTTVVALPEQCASGSQKPDDMSSNAVGQEETTFGLGVLLRSPLEAQSGHSRTSSPAVRLRSPAKAAGHVSLNGSPTIRLGSPIKQIDYVSPEVRPVVELGSPVKPVDHASEDARPVVELGSPVRLADTVSEPQQSPWANGSAKSSQIRENTATTVERVAPESDAEEVSEPQSPWGGNVESLPATTTPATRPLPLSLIPSQSLGKTDEQSPWARGDSQVTAIAQPRLFNPMSSPAISPRLPEPDEPAFPSPRPVPDGASEMVYSPRLPSTPTRYNSSLPTPEFTLSIKSFREFTTPSPVKQRTPLGPADSNGRLPSTQVLADAAASNPWIRPSLRNRVRKKPKKAKRVSWGPLPGEDPASSPTGAELPTQPSSPRHSCPASPPPSSLITPDQLPTENEKFGKHFAAAVAKQRHQGGISRRRSSVPIGTPLARPRRGVSLLPSASQQVCGSPAADAMAEAFIQADEGTRAYSVGLEEARGELVSEGMEGLGDEGPLEHTMEEDIPEEEQDTQKTVDDVTDVLNNLDDFLDTWDVDAELAKARKEDEKREREMREANGGRAAPVASMMDIGMLDAGVWD